MDGLENSQSPEVAAEATFPVKLKPPVFSFLAEGLRPTYQAELEEVQKDGSFKGLQEFHHSSRIGKLMAMMLDQFQNPDEIPKEPVLNLSKEDISFLKDKIQAPADAAGRILRGEMMRDVDSAFSEARFKAKAGAFISGIKSKLKG